MKNILFAALASSVVLGAAPAPKTTCIYAGKLIHDARERPSVNQTIEVRGDKITSIRRGFSCPINGSVIDHRNKTVLPGLIDSHVHLLFEIGPKSRLESVTLSNSDYTLRGVKNAEKTVRAGFTTVADLGTGNTGDAIFALRDAIARGQVIGPRILAAGQSITPFGGHGDVHGYRDELLHTMARPSTCNGPFDCRRAVRAQVKRGADIIKITATGGVLSNTSAGIAQQLFDDEMQAIVQTANALGREVAAHAHGLDGINAAVRAGVSSVEHGTFLDKSSITLFKEKGTYLVPTLIAGQAVIDQAKRGELTDAQAKKAMVVGPQLIKMMSIAHKGGVKIAFGTDSGVSPHGDNAKEFALMQKGGMTSKQALISATINAAQRFKMFDQIGSIAAGKQADIIAVSGNPLDDITVLEQVDWVMANGRVASQ